MFILPCISTGLQFGSVNHTSIYENSKWNNVKNVKYLDEISNNWPNNLLGINIYKTLESCW